MKVADLPYKHGISQATCYHLKGEVAGLDVSQLPPVMALESQNARLKKMYAKRSLAHHAL